MNKFSSLFFLFFLALRAVGQAPNFKFQIADSGLKVASPRAAAAITPASKPAPPSHTRRNFWILVGATLALDAVDTATSQANFGPGAHEAWSGWEMGQRPGAARMGITLGAETAAWSIAAYLLDRRGRHKLGRWAQLAELGIESAAITNNVACLARR